MSNPTSNLLSPDLFLSDVLSRPVFKLNPPSDRLELASEIRTLRSGSFCYVKIPCTDLKSVAQLESLGFHLIETNLFFSKPPQKTLSNRLNLCRPAKSADEASVIAIAQSAFTCTRFHLDPNLSKEHGNLVKEKWVANFFRGKRGHGLLVAEVKGVVAGFLLWLKQETTLIIDLIAVSPSHQGQGIGQGLVHAFEQLELEQTRIVVGTQLVNRTSVQFYEKLGFVLEKADYVFHLHSK